MASHRPHLPYLNAVLAALYFSLLGGQNQAIRNQPSPKLRLHTVQIC